LNTRKSLFFLFFVFLAEVLSAQSFKVSGHVRNTSNQNIGFANIVLLSITDSTMVSGVSADENGFFSFVSIAPDIYFLQASYIDKKSAFLPVDISKDINIGAIILENDVETLNEVTVFSRNPTIERKADRLLFNVENSVVSQGSSWDILKRTPGVIVLQDQLKIRNQNATFYLNNRKIQLSAKEVKSLLEGFSGVNIKAIEVIHNPPAEFEAESGAILNIITSKKIIPGYKGSVNGSFTQAIFPKYSAGTSHYYKTDKLNVFANYSINPRKELKRDDSNITFIDATNTEFADWDTQFSRTTRSLAQNATVVLDYDFDARNSLNITSNLAFSPNKRYDNTLATEMRNGQAQLDSTLLTNSDLENDNLNFGADLSFQHKLAKPGASLNFSAHITSFNENQNQVVFSDYFDASNQFIRAFDFSTDSEQRIDIITGQVDFKTPIDKLSFNSGLKYAAIESTSGINFFNVNGNTSILNPALSDVFKYQEHTASGYISALRDWDKWSLKLGLRGEYTDVTGTSSSTNLQNVQNYFEAFPSLYVSHSPATNHNFSLDYSRKIARPRYEELNPFSYFLNENSFNTGNPNLTPAFGHKLNFNYTLEDTYYFDLYYRDNGNFISTLVFQDNDNQTIRELNQNVLESESYGLDFTYSKALTKNWYVYAYNSIFSEKETFLAVESNNQIVTNEVQGFYGSLTNYLSLSKDGTFTGELGLVYMSSFLEGSYVFSETTNLTFGLRKTLWQKRAVVSLVAEDLLGKANATLTSRYLNQDNFRFSRPETQFVRFGFTYNFGNFKLLDNKRNLEKEERERLNKE